MRRFLNCTRGNFAIAFAVAIVPVLGAAGMAVDYSRALNMQTFLQAQTDGAALAAVRVKAGEDDGRHVDYLKVATSQRFGSGSIQSLNVEADWVTPVDYRITVTGDVPVSILGAVPGFPSSVPLKVSATARLGEPRYIYKPPRISELDNEAGDYNRVYLYCFDAENKTGKSLADRRTQMTAIADNAHTKYTFDMPTCDAGHTLSLRLMNVRLARETPAKWDDPKALRFDYHTDTVFKDGVENYDLGGWSVLETVVCDRLKDCEKKSKGGIVPEGRDRVPVQDKQGCSPGKFIYYGWEDRPPGMSGPAKDWTDVAWTDRDYDDIRIVLECPTIESVENRTVRLVR